MSEERQSGNQNDFEVVKMSNLEMGTINETDKVESSASRLRRFIESNRTKKAVSKIFAGLAVTNVMPGLVAAEVNNISGSDKEITIQGEMPSQKEIVLVDQRERETIDQRFGEFLNGEGIYSDEKLKDKMFFSYLKKVESDLGYCGKSVPSGELIVQGILLSHFELGEKNFLAFGVKNRESERKVVLARWPVDEWIEVFSFMGVRNYKKDKNSVVNGSDIFISEDELFSFIDSNMLNKVVLLNFFDTDGSNVKKLYESGQISKGVNDFFYEIVAPMKETNLKFVSGLLPQTIAGVPDIFYVGSVDNSKDIRDISVRSCSDVETRLTENSDDLPVLITFRYRVAQ